MSNTDQDGQQTADEVSAASVVITAADKIPLDREPDESEIDSFLAEEDPEFFSKLSEIKADSHLRVEEIPIDDEVEALHHEIAKWQDAHGPKKWLYILMPFLPRLTLTLRGLWHRAVASMVSNSIRLRNGLHDLAKGFLKGSKRFFKETVRSSRDRLSKFLRSLKFMSTRLKLLWFATLAIVGLSAAGIYLAVTGKILPPSNELFTANFLEAGADEFEFDSGSRMELFYDNVRSTPNMLLIPKIVANIRSSSSSGENPMVAVEFFAEGMSPEVILEMKDREPHFRDYMQRRIEEFNFDTLDTPPGKRSLTDVLHKELNRMLTQGQLKGLRIKTIVLKP